jgi:rhamnosyltransferase
LWLSTLAAQSYQPDRVLILDSDSTDATRPLAAKAGLEVITIRRVDFDHGGTRQFGSRVLSDCDIVICMTQDAVLAHENSLANLVSTFSDTSIGAVWGRQLPGADATPIAAHARAFNYPSTSRIVSLADRTHLGIRAAFASNSFCGWRRAALESCGGFPTCMLFGEDTLMAAKLLVNGWRIHYAADAPVIHSHNYSLSAEFRRYFDIGVFHTTHQWLLDTFSTATSEGVSFVGSEQKYLAKYGTYWRIQGLLRSATKFAGYHMGRNTQKLPNRLSKAMSMGRHWW